MDKLRLRFEKTGRAVYISHLDLMRTLQRVFFRAGLPLKYSEGYNPHAKISIVLPLSVGMASQCEYLDFGLTEELPLDSLPARLNAAMPEGIRALEVYEAPEKGSALKWIAVSAVFSDCPMEAAYYNDFFSGMDIRVLRRTKRGEAVENIAPYIRRAVFAEKDGRMTAELVLSAQEPSVSPELLMTALGENAPAYRRFTRTAAYRADFTPFR